MKRSRSFILAIVLVVVTALIVCIVSLSILTKYQTQASANQTLFTSHVAGLAPVENCESNSYDVDGAPDAGIQASFVDAHNGTSLNGSLWYFAKNVGGGMQVGGTVCKTALEPERIVIEGFVKGYAPALFAFNLTPNLTTQVTLALVPVCAPQALTCDQFLAQSQRSDTAAYIEWKNSRDNELFARFNLTAADKIQCHECNPNRGGWDRLAGILANGTHFSAYYRTGWCSSGGTDCNNNFCFETNGSNSCLR